MATVVLGVAGAAIPGVGFIAGPVGAALGGYLDQQVVLPLIFPQSNLKGPRLQDLRLSAGDEGTDMTVCVGRAVRMAGTVIYLGDLEEQKKTSGGGLFGLLPETETFRYFVDVDLALCDNKIENLDRILASGKVIFQRGEEEIEVISDQISLDIGLITIPISGISTGALVDDPGGVPAGSTSVHIDGFARLPRQGQVFDALGTFYRVLTATLDGTGDADVTFTPPAQVTWPDNTQLSFLDHIAFNQNTFVTSTDPNADLTQFPVGLDVLMSGWSNSTNNGIFNVFNRSRIDANTTQLVLRSPFNVAAPSTVPEAAGNTITIVASAVRGSVNFQQLTIYSGTTDQPPDPFLESIFGAGNVPSYRGHAHVVIRRFGPLGSYGNQLPNMEFVVKESGTRTVAQAIARILKRSNFAAADYDVSGIDPTIFEGMGIKGLLSAGEVLQPIMLAYDLAARDVNGVLTFLQRANLPTTALNATELGAADFSQPIRMEPVITRDMREEDVPDEVQVRYDDPIRDYQTGLQPAKAQANVRSAPRVVDLGQTLTTAQARAAAERILWASRWGRLAYTISLPPSRLDLLEHDLITFPADGKTHTAMLTKIDRGENFLVEIEALRHDDFFGQNAPSDPPLGHPGSDPSGDPDDPDPTAPDDPPADATLAIFDWAPLRNADVSQPGIYVGATDEVPEVGWPGAVLNESVDGGVTFSEVLSMPTEAVIGRATTALSTALPYVWDRARSVTVDLLEGQLASSTETNVLAGANRAILGGEVIGFVTATLVTGRTYTLSGLLRGLRNTEEWMSKHITGELFMLLTSPGVTQIYPVTSGALGTTRHYVAVPDGRTVDPNFARPHTHQLGTVTAWTPYEVRGSRDGSANLTVTWFRRSRFLGPIFGSSATPLIDPEAYEVDILSAPGGSVLRTISSTTQSASYTSSQQSADGLTPGDPVSLRVYQLSSIGRGRVTETTV